ncbi:MAG TPA: hypothetical protein VEW48_19755 [Thermoanaerobaculia bacterium]|nr:hypothetical protein [Thermoanaerobaculia bacterium]
MGVRENWIVNQAGQGLDAGDHLVVDSTGIWVREKAQYWWNGSIATDQNMNLLDGEDGPKYVLTDDQTTPGTLFCDHLLEGTGVVWTAQEGSI